MIELFINPIRELLQPDFWSATNATAVLSAAAGVVGVGLVVWPMYKQRRTQQILEREFGAELYDPLTIANSTRYYVSPNCSSVDPSHEAELRHVLTTEEGLFEAVDKYLTRGGSQRHILLLADSGMGKSSFVLNYYARNRKRRRGKRLRLAVVPLSMPDADAEIARIENPSGTVIFLDALDEDTKAIQDHRKRLAELMEQCRKFKRVLITCRTQFFPSDEEIPRETGIARFDPRKPGEPGVYEFWKLYISPLNDKQVRQFLRKRYRYTWGKRRKAQEIVNKIPLLSVRPMLLAYTPDLLDSGASIRYSFQLYEVMVEKWLERERGWVDKEQLRLFSEWLARDLLMNRERRGAERIPRAELLRLTKQNGVQLDDWKVTGRSLLNRDAQGNFKFAHRSIMEYLCVMKCVQGDLSLLSVQWTDQMHAFLWEVLKWHAALDVFPPLYGMILQHKDAKAVGAAFNWLTQLTLSRVAAVAPGRPLDDDTLKIISALTLLLLNVTGDGVVSIAVGSDSDAVPARPTPKTVPQKHFEANYTRRDADRLEFDIKMLSWLTFRQAEMQEVITRVKNRKPAADGMFEITYTAKDEEGHVIAVLWLTSKKLIHKVSERRFRHVERLIEAVKART